MKELNLRFPIIMAPMFLVSNLEMVKAAMASGILGTFPTLNYRREGELENVLSELNNFQMVNGKSNQNVLGNYGLNLIVQKSNPLYEKHLKICVQYKVPFFITSLGDPSKTIEAAHRYGAKVYCDVTNLKHAEMVYKKGCDGFIAVGQGAGGHAGPFPLHILVPALKKKFPGIPVVAAGGIADGTAIASVMAAGADGVSIGTRFIASAEANVNDEYKQAIVNAGMGDIVMTERISGTPCAVINTPFAKKIGLKQNWFEKWLSTNKTTKKYFKMLVQLKGFNMLEKAVKPGNYQNLWSAGQSVEMIHDIKPVKQIVETLIDETIQAQQLFNAELDDWKRGLNK